MVPSRPKMTKQVSDNRRQREQRLFCVSNPQPRRNPMSETPDPQVPRVDDRTQFWKEIVWPTARSLEMFFWNLMWFTLIVCLLFSCNPFR